MPDAPKTATVLPTAKTSYVTFTELIDERRARGLMQVCANVLQVEKPDVLHLMLSTPGGHMDSGVALYNFLRALPCVLVTHNIGSVESIAAAVFMAGHTRYVCPSARFVFHGVTWQIPDPLTLCGHQVHEVSSRLAADELRMKAIFKRHSRATDADVNSFLRNGCSVTAERAVELGVADRICDAAIARGSQVLACNFS